MWDLFPFLRPSEWGKWGSEPVEWGYVWKWSKFTSKKLGIFLGVAIEQINQTFDG